MISSLFNVGQTAINASQAWISVTGGNIANADTEGYTRRYVDQRDAGTIVSSPGGEGQGVNAQQVLRYFNSFLESAYVKQSTNSSRWSEQENIMIEWLLFNRPSLRLCSFIMQMSLSSYL